jgi:hypothetical protein
MPGRTDRASVQAECRIGLLFSSTAAAVPIRIIGADLLRLASLLSIILFHVVLKDAQFAAATGSPQGQTFDALIGVSTVFDNRSMAILSLYLLLLRHGDAPYPVMMAERARRLLVPYIAWTLLYPFLDLATAGLAGQQLAFAHVLDLRFWYSAVFLAMAKGHLHFLPTLLVLTALLPVYKSKLSLPLAIVLLASASAIRAGAEVFIVGDVYDPSVADLAALSILRTIEYLPLGFLAFAIVQQPLRVRRPRWFAQVAMAVIALVALSVWLEPEQFSLLGAAMGRLTWSVAQAVLGTVAMVLAAQGVLMGSGVTIGENARLGILGRMFSQRALGLFLVHPFFSDVFDAIVTAPDAYSVPMAIPKFAFVLFSSLFASTILVGTRGLRWIV